MNAVETRRQQFQVRLDSERSTDYRRRMGQFATPFDFAEEVMSFGLTLIDDKPIRFLEPALGTGSFYSALLDLSGKRLIDKAVGIELDTEVANAAKSLWGDKVEIINGDFTKTPLNGFRANLLITNPPYVRHHYIESGDKEDMQARIARDLGISISGLAGLYCHFLLLAHNWLEDGAVSGWLIPSEFMDVNYGIALKNYLLDKVRLVRIHRYDPNTVKFDDALVSSAVVWFENEQMAEDYEVEFSYGGTLDKPAISRKIKRSELKAERKWTRFPESGTRRHENTGLKIKDTFDIKRGIATGDNGFFVLTREKIEKLGLRYDYLTPIVPSPRYLKTTELFADDKGNPVLDRALFLVNCNLPEFKIKELYPELYTYLQTGVDDVAKRYLCKSKKYWYQQEQREPAPILCTYMGRGSKETELPFRFILNHSKAIATNSYLMLYPKDQYKQLLNANSIKLRSIWAELNDLKPSAIIDEARVYGGGLRKIEPKELGEVLCGNSDVRK